MRTSGRRARGKDIRLRLWSSVALLFALSAIPVQAGRFIVRVNGGTTAVSSHGQSENEITEPLVLIAGSPSVSSPGCPSAEHQGSTIADRPRLAAGARTGSTEYR